MINLYPHQEEFMGAIRKALMTHKSIIARAPTGMGKTILAAFIADRTDVLMTVHRKELLRQTETVVKGRICMIQTLTRHDFIPPKVLIVDEAHLSMAKTWQSVIRKCLDAGSLVIGLTATPCRLDGRPLGDIYEAIVESKNEQWLINNGYLSNYTYYVPHIPNMSGARKSKGDYALNDVLTAMNGRVIDDAVGKYKLLASGKRTITFCASIEHSKQTVEAFKAQSIPAEHIDGTMTDNARREAIQRFADNGGIISNVNIMTEGFDLSAQIGRDITVEAVMILRPTASLALHRQMIGRALRRKPYPAIIMDFAGNVERHGFPSDAIEWTLKGKSKRLSDAISIQRCPDCFHVQKPAPICGACGYVFTADGKIIDEVAGELCVIDSVEWNRARRREVDEARTYPELVKIEKSRHYKVGWAEHQYKNKYGIQVSGQDTITVRGYSPWW